MKFFLEDLAYKYKKMRDEYYKWLGEHKLSIGVDSNKKVD